MTEQEILYLEIGQKMKGAEQSQMFGKPCFKTEGKAFICFFQNEMVFKLTGKVREDALGLSGSQLFDPSGKGRAMKEWVQVSHAHTEKWAALAKEAMKYIKK
jgi:hypothetical protein